MHAEADPGGGWKERREEEGGGGCRGRGGRRVWVGEGENGVIRSWFSVCGGGWGRWSEVVQWVWFSGSDTDTVEGFVYRSWV